MSESNDWQVPGEWAEIYETVFGPAMMGEWVPRVTALAKPQPGERVLDVACGTGLLTRLVATAVGPDGRVVGLDLSPDMLAAARKFTRNSSSAAPIEWREGNASAIPFEDEIFDIVACEFGLMFFPDRLAALKEMRRVLVPHGRLIATVWGRISKCPGQTAMRDSWERHFGAEKAAMFYRQHSLDNPELVLSLVQEACFRDASIQTVMGAVRLPSPEHLVRGYGAMAAIQANEKTRAIVIDEVSAFLKPYVGATGLEYPIEAILVSARK